MAISFHHSAKNALVLALVLQEKFKLSFSTKSMNDKRQVGRYALKLKHSKTPRNKKAQRSIHRIKHKYKVKHKKRLHRNKENK